MVRKAPGHDYRVMIEPRSPNTTLVSSLKQYLATLPRAGWLAGMEWHHLQTGTETLNGINHLFYVRPVTVPAGVNQIPKHRNFPIFGSRQIHDNISAQSINLLVHVKDLLGQRRRPGRDTGGHNHEVAGF